MFHIYCPWQVSLDQIMHTSFWPVLVGLTPVLEFPAILVQFVPEYRPIVSCKVSKTPCLVQNSAGLKRRECICSWARTLTMFPNIPVIYTPLPFWLVHSCLDTLDLLYRTLIADFWDIQLVKCKTGCKTGWKACIWAPWVVQLSFWGNQFSTHFGPALGQFQVPLGPKQPETGQSPEKLEGQNGSKQAQHSLKIPVLPSLLGGKSTFWGPRLWSERRRKEQSPWNQRHKRGQNLT